MATFLVTRTQRAEATVEAENADEAQDKAGQVELAFWQTFETDYEVERIEGETP